MHTIRCYTISIFAILMIGGCTGAQLTEQGKAVKLSKEDPGSGCEKLAPVSTTFNQPSQESAVYKIMNLTAEEHGNLLSRITVTEVLRSDQSGRSYSEYKAKGNAWHCAGTPESVDKKP